MSQNSTSIIRQGSTFKRTVTVENLSSSSALELNGVTAFCQIRYKSGDDVLAEMEVDLAAAEEGKITISISAEKTESMPEGAAKSDILFIWSDGSKTHSPIFDVRIEKTITRAT